MDNITEIIDVQFCRIHWTKPEYDYRDINFPYRMNWDAIEIVDSPTNPEFKTYFLITCMAYCPIDKLELKRYAITDGKKWRHAVMGMHGLEVDVLLEPSKSDIEKVHTAIEKFIVQ